MGEPGTKEVLNLDELEASAGFRTGRRHVLSLLVENKPGVLARIAGLFARRGFNIDSLAVGPTDDSSMSRITLTVDGANHPIDQVTKQLHKLVHVIKIRDLEPEEAVARELALFKIAADGDNRAQIMEYADIFRGRIVDVSKRSVTVEVTGADDKIEAFEQMCRPFGLIEMVRTGEIAVAAAAPPPERGAAARRSDAPDQARAVPRGRRGVPLLRAHVVGVRAGPGTGGRALPGLRRRTSATAAQWLYLDQVLELGSEPLRLLHFAPEYALRGLIEARERVDYVTADLDPAGVDVAADITALPFGDGAFDAIVCSHVLEHVDDDRAAMAELARVLRPGGWLVVLVPLDLDRETTHEDPSITAPEDREREYLQHDHVRLYSLDIVERLAGRGPGRSRPQRMDERFPAARLRADPRAT